MPYSQLHHQLQLPKQHRLPPALPSPAVMPSRQLRRRRRSQLQLLGLQLRQSRLRKGCRRVHKL